jgi:hypothetical protein
MLFVHDMVKYAVRVMMDLWKAALYMNINIKNMRNKLLLIIAILGFTFGSCDKESDEFVDNGNTSINLTAPNGQRIAATIEVLTNLVTEVIEEKYGENKDVEINDVIYYDTDQGFIAEIRYMTYDGHSSNLIMSNVTLDGSLGMKKVKTRSEGGNTDNLTIYSCKNENENKCPDCEIGKTQEGVKCFCSKGDRSVCKVQKTQK